MEQFSELFEGADEEDDIRESDEDREQRLREDSKHSNARRQRAWQTLIYRMADGDVVKYQQILEIDHISFLSHALFELKEKKVVKDVKFNPEKR